MNKWIIERLQAVKTQAENQLSLCDHKADYDNTLLIIRHIDFLILAYASGLKKSA